MKFSADAAGRRDGTGTRTEGVGPNQGVESTRQRGGKRRCFEARTLHLKGEMACFALMLGFAEAMGWVPRAAASPSLEPTCKACVKDSYRLRTGCFLSRFTAKARRTQRKHGNGPFAAFAPLWRENEVCRVQFPHLLTHRPEHSILDGPRSSSHPSFTPILRALRVLRGESF